MKFKFRRAFTLTELLISSLIFGFMLLSMATIYSTANKHLFQNYRQNALKTSALIGLQSITARLQEANRIDLPAPNTAGNSLAFAVNIDQLTGCYPINSKPTAPAATWHVFCHAPAVNGACPFGNCLWHHSGTKGGGGGCPNAPFWAGLGSYPAIVCGVSGGNSIVQLASNIDVTTPIFSRRAADNVIGTDIVKVMLHVLWDPAVVVAGDYRSTGQKVDTTYTTAIRLNMAAK